MGARELKDTRGLWSMASTKQGSWWLTEKEAAMVKPSWSTLGPLQMCYGCWLGILGDLLTVGLGVSLTLCLLLGLFSIYWVVSSRFECEDFCLVLLYLVRHALLMSLGGLLFSGVWERRVEGWVWERRKMKGTDRNGGRGICRQDVLYERRKIKLEKKSLWPFAAFYCFFS